VSATFEQIAEQVREYNPSADLAGLEEAYEFAERAHEGQVRKTGEPFIHHPLEVCLILAELHMDTATLIAALLHDVVEDSGVPLSEIEKRFGEEAAALVDGVTKLGQIKFATADEAQSNNMRKMLMAMAKDIRVILIKLADRLHNMRTLSGLEPEKQQTKALETMEIYAPLANRLGISNIKWELEDLAFYYLEPKTFHQVQKMVAESREARETYLYQVKDQLRAELERVGIHAQIYGRPKHLYSIYNKMRTKGKDFNEIYDLIALRVIVQSVKDTYGALGTVHSIWKPVPGRFKDYVAMPKFNLYQSLHTTVIGPAGRPLEIQIRTEEMHNNAEYGIAAHWRYKEGGKADAGFDERLSWLRQMLEWQTEMKDPREFMEALKIDLFADEVFVFTPKGDVISLRRGATPLDFAYAIHTEVGNHTVGAKVNGAIVSLNHELAMGDRIEVLTSKNASPSRDWLGIVKTSSARTKIRSYFSKVTRVDDLQKGKDELQKILRKHGLSMSSSAVVKALSAVSKEMNYVANDDLLAAIGAGKVSPKQIVTKVIKQLQKLGAKLPAVAEPEVKHTPLAPTTPMQPPRDKRRRSQTGIVVKGIDDVLVRLARCCTPVPGDTVIGFVTRGRGVSVHRADCPNARELESQAERLIDVEWDTGRATTFQVEIVIEALDRTHLLHEISSVLAEAGVNILSANVTTDRHGISTMRFLFELGNMERLPGLLAEVRGIEGVFDANRMMPAAQQQHKAKGSRR
jgi:GTP diphosphokinase / guanosine-3',5'-bis(diphosphate) 3'-diphosphatase